VRWLEFVRVEWRFGWRLRVAFGAPQDTYYSRFRHVAFGIALFTDGRLRLGGKLGASARNIRSRV